MVGGGSRSHALWREQLRVIIFEADTPGGKAFDVGLILAILVSILAILLESVNGVSAAWGPQLRALEWTFTLLFTLEYGLRLISVPEPRRYAFSVLGLIDLVSIIPTYLSLLIPGTQSLLVIRGLRLLRVFRVFKLAAFVGEANVLTTALLASRRKVGIFLSTIFILVTILGSLMYLVEGPEHGFTSIPRAMYWAVVTLTTVGYGDISPETPLGQVLASVVMILGYAIIAVPTGIVSAELVQATQEVTTRGCPSCLTEGHRRDARFCRDCGAELALPMDGSAT